MDITRFLPINEYNAAVGAASPSASNVFATMNDLAGVGGDLATTLALGNVTGAHDISVNAGRKIIFPKAGGSSNLELSNPTAGEALIQTTGIVTNGQDIRLRTNSTGKTIILEGTHGAGQQGFKTAGLGSYGIFTMAPTADRTYTFQNASGTVAFLSDIPAATGDGIYSGSGNVPTTIVATLTDTLTFKDGQTIFLNGTASPTLTLDSAFYAERQETANISGNIVGGGFGSLLADQTLTNSTNKVVGQNLTAAWIQTTGGVNLDKPITDVPQLVGGIFKVQTLGTTGTATFTAGVEASVGTSLGTTITHGVGYFSHFKGDNAGTLTNWYGYYMPDLSGWGTTRPSATNRWGIYILDDSLNYIRGKLGIGTITATAKLDIVGIGASPATKGLSISDSTLTENFYVRDDGLVAASVNDFETLSNIKGFVVLDRTNATRYRIYTDGGVLHTELA